MQFLLFLSENPTLRLLQFVLLAIAVVAVFLVFFTTKDVLLRSRSLVFQFFAIVLVAVLPIIGFLLYILIRPSRTLKDREMEDMLHELLERPMTPGDDDKAEEEEASKPKRRRKSENDEDTAS